MWSSHAPWWLYHSIFFFQNIKHIRIKKDESISKVPKRKKYCWQLYFKTNYTPFVCTQLNSFKYWYLIIIIIMSYRQHGYPWPSLATSPYHSSHPTGLLGYILCPHIVAVCKFVLVVPAFAHPYVGVHRSTSLMSSSLLLQRCPACLVRLTCIVFVMGGKCPYSWCLVGCCRQDLFNTALNILV